MYQVPAAVWNKIAATQQMRFPSMKMLMSMSEEEMLLALDEQGKALSQAGVSPTVANAYLTMAPLLAEHQAISAYINQTDNSDLRAALPEVLNAEEAVAIAQQDRSLSEKEQQQLLVMLQRLEPTSENV